MLKFLLCALFLSPVAAQNPPTDVVLHNAWVKWNESTIFQKTANWEPAALRLKSAIDLTTNLPQERLTPTDLYFLAQLKTAYAKVRYRLVTDHPSEQTWSSYLEAADAATAACDAAGHAAQKGQLAASVLMLRAQMDLMNCNYKRAFATSQVVPQLYPAGAKEYAAFGQFVNASEKNGSGPCANHRNEVSAQRKQYAAQLFSAFEMLNKVLTVAKSL